MKRKTDSSKSKKMKSFVGGSAASWSPQHLNPILDSARIEPNQYDGPNPYKLKHARRHAKKYSAIVKRESDLYSDRRYHELILENLLAVEFANLQEITTDWITSTHSRFSHPNPFPLGDGSFYVWDSGSSAEQIKSVRVDRTSPHLEDVKAKVIDTYQRFQSRIKEILDLSAVLRTIQNKPILEFQEDLGLLRVKCTKTGLDLEWTTELSDFQHAVLRDLVEFYYKHPYCLDMMVICKQCRKLLIPIDPRKEYCNQACRERYNNQMKSIRRQAKN